MPTTQNPPGSAFAAGWNLLTTDPNGFFSTLWNGNADSLPTKEVQQVATQAIANPSAFGAGTEKLTSDPITFAGDLGQSVSSAIANAIDPIPTWVKIALIGGLAVVGIVAISFIVHEVNK